MSNKPQRDLDRRTLSSARCRLQWNPERERFHNDDEANAMLSRPQHSPTHLNKPAGPEGDMMLTRRDLIVCVASIAATVTLVAVADVAKPVIGETAWNWNSLVSKKTPVGEVRSIVKGPTATLDELEMHVTTLNPGMASHPPHRHPNEELILVDTGTVEALIDGQWKRIGPGSVVLNASNVLHGLRNVGSTPAQYHVVSWRTDKTPKE